MNYVMRNRPLASSLALIHDANSRLRDGSDRLSRAAAADQKTMIGSRGSATAAPATPSAANAVGEALRSSARGLTGPDRFPRLRRAYEERRAELAAERQGLARERAARLRADEKLYQAERLVAHRELQVVRAYSTRDRRYIAKRERKLADAREQVARARSRRAALP